MENKRTGKLIRRLAAMLFGLVAVAIVLNSVFAYLSTRDTYLQSQTERMTQIGTYAKTSLELAGAEYIDSLDSWGTVSDELQGSSGNTYESTSADWAAEDAIYNDLVQQYNDEWARKDAGEDVETTVTFDQLDSEFALVQHKELVASYYGFANLFDRLKSVFSVNELSVFIPDVDDHTVTYLTEGISGDTTRGDEGVHQYGEVESRDADDYASMWKVVASGVQSSAMAVSPDGSLYLSYVPFRIPDGRTVLIEAGISTEALRTAIAKQMAGTISISSAVFIICVIGLLMALRSLHVRPLAKLSECVGEFAKTKSPDVATRIRAHRWPNDETGTLADGTANMIDEVTSYVESVEKLSAERERTRSELAVASRIQASALPTVDGTLSGYAEFGLAASMEPAKAVGGDFYDFFLTDPTHVAIVIADVSDKGVPAALFMMRAKATIKQFLVEGLPPAEAMARANDDLCHNNDGGMFVTVWLGVLDLASGNLECSCGGHNPPILRRADGSVEWVRKRSGLILGSFEGVPYRGFSLALHSGDALLLYTDGVTEAKDRGDTCYGEDRLKEVIRGLSTSVPDEIASAVAASVHGYSEGTDQADDITMLVLRYTGPGGEKTEG